MKMNFKRRMLVVTLILTMILSCMPVNADLGTYSWAGEWETNWGKMTLTQKGATVTGTYEFDEGRITGTVKGNKLIGTWSEAPSYAPDRDAGDIEFEMAADGQTFTGQWRYGNTGNWGNWDGGKRLTEVILAPAETSVWAEPEIQQALTQKLVPASLLHADLRKPVSREEFAEIAVLLYESATGKEYVTTTQNLFTDTTNTQVLKAFELGITTGTSATTFSPKKLITREECSAMLFRTIKAIAPEGNYSVEGVKDFPDQASIASYAVVATKYMSNLGIVKGDANGYFMPKATTTAQTAAGYGMATREQAIIMSVRTLDKVNP